MAKVRLTTRKIFPRRSYRSLLYLYNKITRHIDPIILNGKVIA